ncbi:MAG: hypothetical protein ACYCS0_01395 [bacterium]
MSDIFSTPLHKLGERIEIFKTDNGKVKTKKTGLIIDIRVIPDGNFEYLIRFDDGKTEQYIFPSNENLIEKYGNNPDIIYSSRKREVTEKNGRMTLGAIREFLRDNADLPSDTPVLYHGKDNVLITAHY